MKIMIVTPYFYPYVGGLENYALNIAKGLQKQGHEVFVVTSNHNGKKRIDEKAQGLRVIRLPYLFKFSNTPINPAWRRQLKKIIKAEKPNIINAHTPVPGLADVAISAAGKIPTALTYHAASLRKDDSQLIFNIVARLYELIQLHTLKKATSIIAVSDYVRENLPRKFQNKTAVIYNAIDPSYISKTNVSRKSNRLIFVGNLDRTHAWKGLGEILKAMQLVKKTNTDVELIVIGDGDMLDSYKQQVKLLGLRKNVIFRGSITGTKKYKLIQSSSAMIVYPVTANDAFPTVFLEAWTCHTPIIAADIGALSDLIRQMYGYLVAPHDPLALAKAINKLLNNESMAYDFGLHGRSTVEEKFSLQSSIKNTAGLFEQLNRPKIIHVTAYYPPHLGGQEIIVRKLSENLAIQGYDNKVFTSSLGSKAGITVENNVIVKRMRSIEFASSAIIWALFAQLVKQTSSETVVDLHIGQAYTPEIVWLASKVKGFKYIAHIYIDSTKTGPMGFLLPFYKQHVFKKVLLGATTIIVPTADYKDLIEKQYSVNENKIVVIPFGTDHHVVKQPKSVSASGNTIKLLFVGRLANQKNIPLMLKTIETYTKHYSKGVTLNIVGSGELRKQVEKTILEKDLKNIVKMNGALFGSDLESKYSQADIFILTSNQESFGLVLIEAMTKGLPIVSVDILAVKNVVINGKNGFLCPEDPMSLAEAIHKLVTDKGLYTRISKNNISNAENYRWDEIAKKLSLVYESL